MKSGKWSFFLLIVLSSFSFGGDLWGARNANMVEIDGDRLTVRADGVALAELLRVIEDMTSVQFSFDPSLAENKVFLDLEGLPLSKGIEKIVSHLNSVRVYDEEGKLRKVFIFGRGKDSGRGEPQEETPSSRENLHFDPPDRASHKVKIGPVSSAASNNSPAGKESAHPHHSLRDRGRPVGGPPSPPDQGMEGPTLSRVSPEDGPPKTPQTATLGNPLKRGHAGDLPSQDSGSSQMDGPPLDRPYEMDGPPGWRDLLQ